MSLQDFAKERMKNVDEAHLDPDQRAELVNSFIFHALGLNDPKDVIEQPLYWDLLCYCFEMLLKYAIVREDRNTLLAMKQVNSFMHSAHYSGRIGEDSFLGPDRDEHEKIWVERIEKFVKKTFRIEQSPAGVPRIIEEFDAQHKNYPKPIGKK